MLATRYQEIMADDPRQNRSAEFELIETSIRMLREAEQIGVGTRECSEAFFFVNRLWSAFIVDLGQPENDLPQDLRASLISIGLFILRTIEDIRSGKSTDFAAVIEISQNVADGLKP